jgi:hypothetical protein
MAMHGIETSWAQWRRVFGAPRSAQRRDLLALLETQPALLYWGDSWFTTPLYRNLAVQSMRRIDGLAMIAGKPGATAAELFGKRSIDRTLAWLKEYPFDVLCLSAGGNDGLCKRLEGVFGKRRSGPDLSAAEAFERVLDAKLFDKVAGRYRALLRALAPLQRSRPHFRVIGHGYAPLLRIGVPATLTLDNIGLVAAFKRDTGPWLWKPMQHVLSSKKEGQRFADLLMTEGFLKRVLKPMTSDFAGLFSHADFSGVADVVTVPFWNDEIHPTETGFEALAPVLNTKIRDALPGGKKAAVR